MKEVRYKDEIKTLFNEIKFFTNLLKNIKSDNKNIKELNNQLSNKIENINAHNEDTLKSNTK